MFDNDRRPYSLVLSSFSLVLLILSSHPIDDRHPLPRLGYCPDVISFNTAIDACASCDKWREAVELLEVEMPAAKVLASAVAWVSGKRAWETRGGRCCVFIAMATVVASRKVFALVLRRGRNGRATKNDLFCFSLFLQMARPRAASHQFNGWARGAGDGSHSPSSQPWLPLVLRFSSIAEFVLSPCVASSPSFVPGEARRNFLHLCDSCLLWSQRQLGESLRGTCPLSALA